MIDDVTLNKAAIIRRCLARVREEFQGEIGRLDDFTTQDAIILNVLRACEASIDLAMHTVAARRLGIPQNSRDAFEFLEQASVLSKNTTVAMKKWSVSGTLQCIPINNLRGRFWKRFW